MYCANAIHNGRTVEDTLGAIRGRVFLELLEFSFESSVDQLDESALRVLLFLALSKHARSRRDLLQVVADDGQLDDVLPSLTAMSFVKPSWEQKKQMRFAVENPLLRDYVKKRVPEVLPQQQCALVLRKAQVLPADAESPSVAIELQRAMTEAKSQDWRQAIKTLESARQAWGDDPTLLAELGYYYYRTENRAAARHLLEAAISKGHESASTYFHLSLVLYYEGVFDDALRYVKTSLTLKSPFPLADQLAGQLLLAKTRSAALLLDNRMKRARLEEAARHYQRSLIPDEIGFRDEAHNHRSQEAIRTIGTQLAELE